MCQKRLRLSLKVDGCKPLDNGTMLAFWQAAEDTEAGRCRLTPSNLC